MEIDTFAMFQKWLRLHDPHEGCTYQVQTSDFEDYWTEDAESFAK